MPSLWPIFTWVYLSGLLLWKFHESSVKTHCWKMSLIWMTAVSCRSYGRAETYRPGIHESLESLASPPVCTGEGTGNTGHDYTCQMDLLGPSQ